MLFNSFPFLLVFLPVSLLIYWTAERLFPLWRLPVLLALSFAFYGYWDWHFVPLLGCSIFANWLVAESFWTIGSGVLIPLAIVGNLAVLAFFKYFNFFAGVVGLTSGLQPVRLDIVLPLGISFFTFHHVMYLADLRAKKSPRLDLIRYGLYIAFFPQVLAGPLVRWSEIVHQFDERPYRGPDASARFSRGLMLLVIGLAKKAFLGDPLSAYVNPIFQAAANGEAITFFGAWQATLGFTFQIYFDFSGYTDMALGIALLFGLMLPQNFDVPYSATSLQDFWRRWHMTLSRFLRDYLYIPFGGSKHGLPIQIGALLATMALGGLWHGAGWTFVVWGVAHGLGLGVGVLWRRTGLFIPARVAWPLTFLFVVLCWVLFRATNLGAAAHIYRALFNFSSIGRLRPDYGLPLIMFAALAAIVGPSAWNLVQRIPPWPINATAFATAFALVLLKLGDGANYQFIYFQF